MQIRASHILVSSLDKANWISSKIKEGKDFAELAEKYSECPSSQKGGDLGYFSKGQMVKEFENVAYSLEVGKVSEPVKTQFGYHLIELTDKK